MRDYSKVSPQFWYGKTGKALKAKGPEAVIVALYLMTCQHANMLGLYHLNPAYIGPDTGLDSEGASKGLAWACEAGFCQFDRDSEVVWVVEMASYQIGASIDAKDNRCKGIQREYDALPDNQFLRAFYERYGVVFCMTNCRGIPKPLRSPSKAPPKPRAGTGEGTRAGTGAGDTAPEARELFLSDLVAEGIDPGIAETWLKVRAKKKAPLTALAWDGVKREAAIAGMTPAQAVLTAAESNWQGFKASWITKAGANGASRQDALEARNAATVQRLLEEDHATQ